MYQCAYCILVYGLEHDGRWIFYPFDHPENVQPGEDWEDAYHGTWWYAVPNIFRRGIVLESHDEALGHECWHAAMFCTPLLATALTYARAAVLFSDGVFCRAVLSVRVKPFKKRAAGGTQWLCQPDGVSIQGLIVQLGARLNVWSGKEECMLAYNPMLTLSLPP